MDTPTVIDLSGNMEIPSGKGSVHGGLGMEGQSYLPTGNMGSVPTGPPPAFGSVNPPGATSALLLRKLWSGVERVRQIPFVQKVSGTGRENMRSWLDFCNWRKFRRPALNKLVTREYYTGRLFRNLHYFHINYLCIVLILFLYCILTSPLLLIVLFISGGAFYYAHSANAVRKITVAGREITLTHQYMVIGGLSLLLFYLAGAGAAMMGVLSLSLFIILLHAAFFGIEDDGQENFDFKLEEVV